MSLSKKIDFAVIIGVKNANPNGDPLNGNRPRTSYEGIGEISDVCLKRKIRNRLMNKGHSIFVQSDDSKLDDAKSLKDRYTKTLGDNVDTVKACETWLDVRAFGQLFAFSASKGKKTKKSNDGDTGGDGSIDGVSVPIRGPVSIHSAFSVEPVSITSIQITKSVNSEDTDSGKKSSDTMGMKHRIDSGVYVFYGSMNPQLAEKTKFSYDDARVIKDVLITLFENDASSARPDGSMKVLKVIWWEHSSKEGNYSSAKVHESLKVAKDGSYELIPLEGLKPEEIYGF
jgi:CRISPR-associated protein Csd2